MQIRGARRGNINLKNVLLVVMGLTMLLIFGCERQPSLPALPEDAVILAFGDSLTYGTGASADRDYPTILGQLVSLEVINAGVPGEISADGVNRLSPLLEQYDPDLLILIHGGNDMLRKIPSKDTVRNLNNMIRSGLDRGISVILLGVPKPGLFLNSAEMYQTLAHQNQIPIDTETLPEILGNRGLKSDAIHPNDKGYQLMAEAIHQLFKKRGALPN